jgi:RNA polymerase sigma factor (sigma-70 family)
MNEQDQLNNQQNRRGNMVAIVNEYQGALLRYATRLVRDGDAAQDVVQNVFVKLFTKGGDRERSAGQLKSWLYRVTHNEAVSYIRKESRRRDLHDRQADDPAISPARVSMPAVGSAKAEQRHAVLAMVDTLSPVERQVLLLRLEEGLSYKEIAAITERTVGNVGKVLHHAVKKLSEKAKEAGLVKL